VPHETLLPYCDGDVSDLQGVHFYDDARYSAPGDLTRKHTVYFMGANHNFANTVWTSGFPGSGDDRGGNGDTRADHGYLTSARRRDGLRVHTERRVRRGVAGAVAVQSDRAQQPAAAHDPECPLIYARDEPVAWRLHSRFGDLHERVTRRLARRERVPDAAVPH